MGARPDSAFADHCAAEAVQAQAGTPFTALRHGFYAESAFHLIGRGFDTGETRALEDGAVSRPARSDLAAGDAAIPKKASGSGLTSRHELSTKLAIT